MDGEQKINILAHAVNLQFIYKHDVKLWVHAGLLAWVNSTGN